jgi:hypothetical protein
LPYKEHNQFWFSIERNLAPRLSLCYVYVSCPVEMRCSPLWRT